jgi:hypothetical protein
MWAFKCILFYILFFSSTQASMASNMANSDSDESSVAMEIATVPSLAEPEFGLWAKIRTFCPHQLLPKSQMRSSANERRELMMQRGALQKASTKECRSRNLRPFFISRLTRFLKYLLVNFASFRLMQICHSVT